MKVFLMFCEVITFVLALAMAGIFLFTWAVPLRSHEAEEFIFAYGFQITIGSAVACLAFNKLLNVLETTKVPARYETAFMAIGVGGISFSTFAYLAHRPALFSGLAFWVTAALSVFCIALSYAFHLKDEQLLDLEKEI